MICSMGAKNFLAHRLDSVYTCFSALDLTWGYRRENRSLTAGLGFPPSYFQKPVPGNVDQAAVSGEQAGVGPAL